MSPARAVRDRRGLTLIELILTLSILGLAGVLVSGAFTASLRAWQSGFAAGRGEVIARVVLERIAAQLRAVVPSTTKLTQQPAIAFEAKEHALRFVTSGAAGAAPVQVSYALEDAPDGARLVYREYPWPDKDFFGEHRARREETVPEVAGFTVAVVKRPDENPGEEEPPQPAQTTGEWSPRDQILPKSVTIDLTLRAEGGAEPRNYRLSMALAGQGAP